MLFVGTHERQLDDKGRLALPAPFRAHLGEHCYLTVGDDRCVTVVPATTFEQLAAQMMDKVARGEMSLQRQRAMASNASLVTVDKQGRVMVDEKLRTFAGLPLEQRVVVTGNFNVIELWSPDRFARVNEVGTEDLRGEVLP